MPSRERKKLHVPGMLAVVTLAAAAATIGCGDNKPQQCTDGSGGAQPGSGGSGGSETAAGGCGGSTSEGGSHA